MNRIDHYKFMAKGTLDHLKGRIHLDLYQGVEKIAQGITAYLDRYGEAREKIQGNLSLSRTGQNEQIEAAAKTAYDAIHGMRDKSDYRGHIAQLNKQIDDQLTTEFRYKFNPKWMFRTYTRFDLRNGILKEQEYTFTRDLHCWTMDINFNETRNEGNEIWLVFTLKAFPDMAIDFGTSFNKRKAGSQSSGGN